MEEWEYCSNMLVRWRKSSAKGYTLELLTSGAVCDRSHGLRGNPRWRCSYLATPLASVFLPLIWLELLGKVGHCKHMGSYYVFSVHGSCKVLHHTDSMVSFKIIITNHATDFYRLLPDEY